MSSAQSRLVVMESPDFVAYLHPRPWTPGSVILERRSPGRLGAGVFQLPEPEYLSMLLGARAVGALLCDRLGVHRCALVTRPQPDTPAQIRVLPLHGVDGEWCPHLATEEEYSPFDPGFCTSKSGPRWSNDRLAEVQAKVRAKLPSPDAPANLTFLGDDPGHPGLFSRIVRGEVPQWRVWEDVGHVAFLTPFPNAAGLTVVVPRRPLASDVLRLDGSDYQGLALAARRVAALLVAGLGATGVGLIFEGYEIDYAHAKLIPLLPPALSGEGELPSSNPRHARFHATYPGFVTSEDGPESRPGSLKEFFDRITGCGT
ncbi:hypothetical protein NHX12_018407 [Muraenolepis orangiensis]|uniref:HIT domain-containing protein n=1 Tax=Muraenolepis orangiensis TaxID=630683 RepID=A0A9Q0F0S1_9TELE|nr:hypothetical protein NHX12_018407 [Muraenolepis orangiensis]